MVRVAIDSCVRNINEFLDVVAVFAVEHLFNIIKVLKHVFECFLAAFDFVEQIFLQFLLLIKNLLVLVGAMCARPRQPTTCQESALTVELEGVAALGGVPFP